MKMEDEVRKKLRLGIYIIKRKKGQAAKSNVWDRFSEIVAAGDNSSIGYVKCNLCEKIYKHKSHTTGTSSMSRHICGGSKKKDVVASLQGDVSKHFQAEIKSVFIYITMPSMSI